MGLSTDLVVEGQENHAAEFLCPVCCQLVDAPLLTVCHHIFCLSCLQDWMETKPSCPTCMRELDPRHGAGELRLASPLAFRVLGRLKLHCPLEGCPWVGEYSELSAHMTSSETHLAAQSGNGEVTGAAANGGPGTPSASALQQAEALKNAGNSKFEQRIYAEALALYSKAVALAPTVPTYLLNRAATHLMMGKHAKCIDDCQAALRIDPKLTKAYKRIAKAHIEQGEYAKAVLQLASFPGTSAAAPHPDLASELASATELRDWQLEGEAALSNGNGALARTFFANICAKTSAAVARLWMVRAELALGLCDRALRTTREVIKEDPNSTTAYRLRAVALLYSADLEQAQKHLKQALRLDPDDSEAGRTMKKVRKLEAHMSTAKQAAYTRDFALAATEYSNAITAAEAPMHAPLSASLHAERAAAHLRLKDYDAALKDCAVAIYAQDDCKAAWLTKADALHALERHEEAARELQTIRDTFGGNDTQINHALQRAQFEIRKRKRPDYYGLLQVPSIASALEIKAAYKARALECHPDKVAAMEKEAKKEAEERFKLLGEALEILTDDFKRKLWNEGYDREAIFERVRAAERAASNHNKDGCCGGGGCQ